MGGGLAVGFGNVGLGNVTVVIYSINCATFLEDGVCTCAPCIAVYSLSS